jgi:integrase
VKKYRYGDLRNALIELYGTKGRKSLQTLSNGEETIFGMTPLDKFFGFESGKKPGVAVTSITEDTIRKFVRERQQDDGVTGSTINGSLRLLRRMLRLAHKEGKLRRVPNIELLMENPARKGFLSETDFEKLFAAIPLDLKALVTFLYYCGVRRGEALAIEWKQVDLDRRIIRLEEEQTKSGEARIIPLGKRLPEMLRQIEPKEGRVFNVTEYRLREEFRKAALAAGLGAGRKGGLIVHDLRRSGARNLRRAGVPESVAMKITGHKTRAIFERYNIVDEKDVTEAMDQREEKITATPVEPELSPKSLAGKSSVRVSEPRKSAKLLKSSNEVA